MNVRQVHIDRLVAHPANIRCQVQVADVRELAASIAARGILQPLVVEPAAGGRYTVLAGARRLAAAKLAGQQVVPVVVRAGPSPLNAAVEVMLAENWHRTDLSAVEKAHALGRLREAGYTIAAITKTTGIAPASVSRHLLLLDLDQASLARVAEGTLPVGDAIAAIRHTRRVRRGGSARRPARAGTRHFTTRHALAAAARAACDHPTRPLVGGVACGQCWEQAIRADERTHQQPAAVEPVRQVATDRQGRVAAYAELRGFGLSRRQAAARLGVDPRTAQRYNRDLATTGGGARR